MTTKAGSRLHILDWVAGYGGREFPDSLNVMLRPTGVSVPSDGVWRPTSHSNAAEALLDRPCAPLLPEQVSRRLRSWWLAVDRPTASGPNWDLAAEADFPDGRRGLVLIEAKAHAGELHGEEGGMRVRPDSNLANRARIGEAIAEARDGLGGEAGGVRISRDNRYQFCNRIAFSWRLAAWNVPVVLVYLGFTGDEVIGKLSEPIRDDVAWQMLIARHTKPVLSAEMWNRDLGTTRGSAPLWLLARSLPVARQSPEKELRRRR